MRCEDVLEYLTDGSVELPTEALSHLEDCAECQAAQRQLVESWDMLDVWPALEPSSDFTARVMMAVGHQDEQCARLLAQALEAEQPSDIAADVRAHLDECERCSAEYASVGAAWQILGEWRDIEPSPGFVKATVERAITAPAPLKAVPSMGLRPTRPAPSFFSPRTLRAVASLVAVFAVVVGIFVLMRPDIEGPPTLTPDESAHRPAVVATLTTQSSETSEIRILNDVRDPSASMKTDDVLEEILKDPDSQG